MNPQLIAQEALQFGKKFFLVTSSVPASKSLATDISEALIALGAKTLITTENIGSVDEVETDEVTAEYDVIILCDIKKPFKEHEYNRVVLCVGDVISLDAKEGSDKYVWHSDCRFKNHLDTTRSIMNLDGGNAHSAGSWDRALEVSFTPLFPYRQENLLYPVYAGPIQEHAIDLVNTQELVEQCLQQIYEGRRVIVFDDKDEALFWHRIYKVHMVIRRLDHLLPPGSFMFLTSSINATEIYTKWCKSVGVEESLKMIPSARFESVSKDMLFDGGLLANYKKLDKPISTARREKKYLCFNRMPRLHRIKCIIELHKANIIESGFVSFCNEDNLIDRWLDDKHYYSRITSSDECPWTADFKYFEDNISPMLPLILNKTEERWNPADLAEDDLVYFDQSYFSIVNETLMYKDTYKYKELVDISPTDSIFLSEKIYKPLACKHPFIVIGVDGTLNALSKFGYKTFNKWIDESYDLEPDDDIRHNMVMDEVKRLTALSHEEWQAMIEEMIPTLQHNFDTLCRSKNLIADNINFMELFKNKTAY
jgi:hypothetical protein|tara:strand:+ start:3568 stop:5181 length:1614 start_codon:yes stop_codon:yes gene_type:complete